MDFLFVDIAIHLNKRETIIITWESRKYLQGILTSARLEASVVGI